MAIGLAQTGHSSASPSFTDSILLTVLDPMGISRGAINHTMESASKFASEAGASVGLDVSEASAAIAHVLELTTTGVHVSPYATAPNSSQTWIVLSSESTPFHVQCRVNRVALRYPLRAAAGLFLFGNAGFISEYMPLYYGTGFITGGVAALILLFVFLFRNRANRAAWAVGLLTAGTTLLDSYTSSVSQLVMGRTVGSSITSTVITYISEHTLLLIAVYFTVSGCIFMGIMYLWRAAENDRIHNIIYIAVRVLGAALLLSAIQPWQLQVVVLVAVTAAFVVYHAARLVVITVTHVVRAIMCVLETITYPIPCCWPVFASCRRACPTCFCKRSGEHEDDDTEYDDAGTPEAPQRPIAVATERVQRGRRMSRDPAAIRGMFSAPQAQRPRSVSTPQPVPVPIPMHADFDAVDDHAGEYMHAPIVAEHYPPPQARSAAQQAAYYVQRAQQHGAVHASAQRAAPIPTARFAPPLVSNYAPAYTQPATRPTAPPASPAHDDEDEPQEGEEDAPITGEEPEVMDEDEQGEAEEQEDEEEADEEVWHDDRMDDSAPDAHMHTGKRPRSAQTRTPAPVARPRAVHAPGAHKRAHMA